MITVLKNTASFLSCCILAVSQVPDAFVFAEEKNQGTVTVTVYDDETGELADQNLTFQIYETTEGLQQHGIAYRTDRWNVSETNPYTMKRFRSDHAGYMVLRFGTIMIHCTIFQSMRKNRRMHLILKPTQTRTFRSM